jgi:AcrR family transcriptional regulator
MDTHIADKERAILAAALRLIAANGFHGAPMSKVAKEAGVSTGIIYHYFESKDALIGALYRTVKLEFARATLHDHDPDAPIPQQLRQTLQNAIHYFVAHPDATVFMEQFMRSPYSRLPGDPEVDAQYAPLQAMIDHACEEQIIKALPLPVLYSFTLDVASSVAQKHAAGMLDLSDDLIDQIVDTCWDAVRR